MKDQSQKISRIFFIGLLLIHALLIVYVYIMGNGKGDVPFPSYALYVVVFYGMITGSFSITNLIQNLLEKGTKINYLTISNVILSLLIIPQWFMISLIYFFEMN